MLKVKLKAPSRYTPADGNCAMNAYIIGLENVEAYPEVPQSLRKNAVQIVKEATS